MPRIEALTLKNEAEVSEEQKRIIQIRIEEWRAYNEAKRQKAANQRITLPAEPHRGRYIWVVKLNVKDIENYQSDPDYLAANEITQKTGGGVKRAEFGAEEPGHDREFLYVGPFADEKLARAMQIRINEAANKLRNPRKRKSNLPPSSPRRRGY